MGSLLAQLGREIEKNAKHKTSESTIANILTQAVNALKEARGASTIGKQKLNIPIGNLDSLAAARPAGKRVWNCTAMSDCPKECEYGWATLKPIVCEQHQEEGMDKYIPKRRCGQGRACPKQPTFGWHGKSAVACKLHADPDMVNTVSKLCGAGDHEPCVKRPTYGWPGTNKALRCKEHAEPGMRDVAHSWCSEVGCDKRGKYAFPNSSSIRAARCEKHVLPGMEDFTTKRCTVRGCMNVPESLQVGSKRRCREHENAPEGRQKRAREERSEDAPLQAVPGVTLGDEDMPLRPGGSFVAALGGFGGEVVRRVSNEGLLGGLPDQHLPGFSTDLVARSS